MILAIYADHPAAVKCTLTGSSCPICYTPRDSMSTWDPEVEFVMRNPENMAHRKRVINLIFNSGNRNAKPNARKRARLNGINLDISNAWSDENDLSEDWVFGPDTNLDNVWQNTPQVNLHGMDEGLVQKLNYGALHTAIDEAKTNSHVDATKVRISACCALLRMRHAHNTTPMVVHRPFISFAGKSIMYSRRYGRGAMQTRTLN